MLSTAGWSGAPREQGAGASLVAWATAGREWEEAGRAVSRRPQAGGRAEGGGPRLGGMGLRGSAGKPPSGWRQSLCVPSGRPVCAVLHGVRLPSSRPTPHLCRAAAALGTERPFCCSSSAASGRRSSDSHFLSPLAVRLPLLGRRFPLALRTLAPVPQSLPLQAPRCALAPAAAWAAPGTRAGWRQACSSGPAPATTFTG